METTRRTGGPRLRRTTRAVLSAALIATTVLFPTSLAAQWVTTHEQFYLQASHNWVFRNTYAAADRLFNAFDYGHAILYETLWTRPNAAPAELEVTEYDFLTKRVLVRPPRLPLEEGAIEIKYVQLAPEAKQMFEWAHLLHRQLYDVLADERLDQTSKDREVRRLLDYYKSRTDVAFSSKPKSMKLMQEQPYSLAFRTQYPKFNGLIWGYHWLQVGLYEPLLVGTTVESRQAGVRATTARFWQMLQDPPRTFPHQMPMTAAVAPVFAARYQEAAIIFDNLHSMHDVISDILANDRVPRHRKRAEILLAAARFRDDTSYVMTPAAWLAMTGHMGVENMGGPSVGFLAALPTPTVTYGAVMTHDDRTGSMIGFASGQATGGAHEGQGGAPGVTSAPPDTTGMAGMQHANMNHARRSPIGQRVEAATPQDPSHLHEARHVLPVPTPLAPTAVEILLREMYEAMLRDPTIRARVFADPSLRARHQSLESLGAVDAMPPDLPSRRSRSPAPARAKTRAKVPRKTAPPPLDPHAAQKSPPARPQGKKPPVAARP